MRGCKERLATGQLSVLQGAGDVLCVLLACNLFPPGWCSATASLTVDEEPAAIWGKAFASADLKEQMTEKGVPSTQSPYKTAGKAEALTSGRIFPSFPPSLLHSFLATEAGLPGVGLR